MRKLKTAEAGHQAADLRQRAARARDAAERFIRRAGQLEATSTPVMPDSVHALIEEHRAAYAEWDRLSAVWNDMEVDAPGYREAMAASDEPGQREIAAYKALFSARPTTFAGTAALGAYLSEAIRATSTHAQPTDGEQALATITAALRRLDLSLVTPHPDAALFALGAEFMAAWVAEEANGDEAEYRACSRIARQIMRTPAETVADYGIKALLLARLDSDVSGPHTPIEPHGPADSWWNALRQLQQGAALLAGTPGAGVRASVGQINGRLPVPDRDLSELSIQQLARLYPVMVRAEKTIGSAENAPCFLDWERAQRTAAGHIINREADRLSRFSALIVEEMRRRQPADEDEAEERASTLLAHMALVGGVAEHPELIAEINATWGA